MNPYQNRVIRTVIEILASFESHTGKAVRIEKVSGYSYDSYCQAVWYDITVATLDTVEKGAKKFEPYWNSSCIDSMFMEKYNDLVQKFLKEDFGC